MKAGSVSWAALLFGALLMVAGCDDDGGGGTTNPDADAGDAQGDQGGNDATPDQEVNSCGAATACAGNGDCADDEVCVAGCCEPEPVVENCTSQGQACTGDAWSNDNFICDTGVQQCLARCDSSTTDATQENSCSRGSWCFALNAEDQTDLLDGACLLGDCNDACFDPADCAEGTAFSCDDGNGTCYAFGNGASFCFAAGDAAEGDECLFDSEEPADVCDSGLLCFNGVCEAPCAFDEEDPTAGCDTGECIPVFDQTGNNLPGLCGSECDPFSRDQCGEGLGCEPVVGSFSGELLTWFCTELFEDDNGDIVPTVAEGESCDVDGSDGFSNQCGEGMQCVANFEGDTEGVCSKLCDFTLESEEDSARCLAADPGEPILVDNEVAAYTDEGDVLGWVDAAAGDGLDLQVWSEPASEGADPELVASINDVSLAEGTANTLIAHLDADGEAQVTALLDWDAETTAIPGGEAGARVHNVSDSDVTIHGAEPLHLDQEPGSFTAVDEELTFNDVYTNILLTGEDWLIAMHVPEAEEPTGFLEVVALEDLTPEPAAPVRLESYGSEVPAGLDTTGAAVRVINASVVNATVDVDFSPGEMTDIDDLGYAEASAELAEEWEINDIGDGETVDFSVTIPLDGDDLVVDIENAQRGDIFTIVLWDGGEAGALDYMLLTGVGEPGETADVAYRLSNAAGEDVNLWLESNEPLELAAGASQPDADGAGDFFVGEVLAVVRDPDAPLGDTPLANTGRLTVVADDLLTAVVANDDADGLILVTHFSDAPDVSGLGAGEALVRFINAAPGVGPIRVETLGEALQVCAPLSVEGLGRCMERCSPYVPGVPYNDESGDPAARWEDNGCTHTEDILYACFPFITTGDQDTVVELDGPPDLEGFCVPRDAETATGGFGDECTDVGDPACNPDSWCVGITETRAECTKLCLPYSGEGDADCEDPGLCFGLALAQEYGFCFEPDLSDAAEGDACTQAQSFQTCGSDDTICLGLTTGGATQYECRRLCKRDVAETCPDLDGEPRECSTDVTFGAGAPAWFSICLPPVEG